MVIKVKIKNTNAETLVHLYLSTPTVDI